MEEEKILNDDFFEFKGHKFRIPSTYLKNKIGEISKKIELDESKLTKDEDGIKYALMLNSTYGKEVVEIVGIILYGRNFLYNNMFTRPFSHIYRRYKTSKLMHEMTNKEIEEVFYLFVTNSNLSGFLNAIRYTSAMTSKDNQIA